VVACAKKQAVVSLIDSDFEKSKSLTVKNKKGAKFLSKDPEIKKNN